MRGGLSPFFVAKGLPDRDFQEWMNVYWATDIQELFRLSDAIRSSASSSCSWPRLSRYPQNDLTLNETKTHLVDARKESFNLLGFEIRVNKSWKLGKSYPHVCLALKSLAKIKERMKQ